MWCGFQMSLSDTAIIYICMTHVFTNVLSDFTQSHCWCFQPPAPGCVTFKSLIYTYLYTINIGIWQKLTDPGAPVCNISIVHVHVFKPNYFQDSNCTQWSSTVSQRLFKVRIRKWVILYLTSSEPLAHLYIQSFVWIQTPHQILDITYNISTTYTTCVYIINLSLLYRQAYAC